MLSHPLRPADWFALRFWSEPIVLEFLFSMLLGNLYLAKLRLPAIGLIGLAIAVFAFGDPLGLTILRRAGRLRISALLICAVAVLVPQPHVVERGWQMSAAIGYASYALYLAQYLIVHAVILGW